MDVGFAKMVKKLGDKTFRYFRMTQMDKDFSHKQKMFINSIF
jgi:hypothetical protein